MEKWAGSVQSNIDVCLVSSPVTRNVIGWPDNVTPLASPGIRLIAFALIKIPKIGSSSRNVDPFPTHDEDASSQLNDK